MNAYDGLESFEAPREGVVFAIGNFDGVHRGHRCIIETARRAAAELGTPAVVMTFEPHPLAIVAPHRAPPRLTTSAEKLALLRLAGVDSTIVMRSEPGLLSRSPEDFLTWLVERGRPRAIVAGATFRFGRKREGSAETLRQYGERFGYTSHILDLVVGEELAGRPTISSSTIRRALIEGRLDEANALLGRAYRIVGVVGGGDGRGAPLGFPTANLTDVPHLLPSEAVYAAVAELDDGEFFLAAVNVGPQPTFGQSAPRVEAHLLDYTGDLRGRRLGLHFVAKLRGQRKFANVDELVQQLREDVERTRACASELDTVRAAPQIPL